MFRWELKKLLRRRSSLAAAVLAVALAALFGALNIFSLARVETAGGRLSGPRAIREQLARADAWRGELTEEKLIAAQGALAALAQDPANLREDGCNPTDRGWRLAQEALGSTLYTLMSWAPEYLGDGPANGFWTLPPQRYAGFYAAWRACVQRAVAAQHDDDPAAAAMYLRKLAGVKTPFTYDDTEGVMDFISLLDTVNRLAALLLCVALAPLFAGEVQCGAAPILLCAKRGRGRLAGVKLAAALTFTAAVYALCAAVYLAFQFAFYGTRGLGASVQLTAPMAALPLTYAGLELFGLGLGLGACLACVGFTAFFSARAGSPFPALAAVFGVLFLLPALGRYLPRALAEVCAFLPYGTMTEELTFNNAYTLFGHSLPVPLARLGGYFLMAAALLPLAARSWPKRQIS